MEQNKDQSGAAVRGKVDLQARLPASGPLTEVVTTIFRRARTSDTEACTFSASSVATPVAAVRGEAVADDIKYEVIVDRRDLFDFLRAAWRDGSMEGWTDNAESWHKATDHANSAIKGWSTLRPNVSARAADAPSEPIELVLAFGKGLIEVGQGHHGNERKPAILFGRNGAGAVGIETEGDRVMLPGECIAALTFDNPESLDVVAEKFSELRARIWPKSRAADALDSQPTEPDGLPPLPEPIEVGGEGWDFDDFKSEKTFSCEHMWAYARAAIASSQPTDGGVRNG